MNEHTEIPSESEPAAGESPRRQRYVPAVGPRLKKLLAVVFGLFAVLAVNSIYLVSVRGLEAATGRTYQNWFYLVMFLLHLVLGLAIVLPVVIFGVLHLKNARHRPNRRAVRVGYALFTTALVLLASGIVLTRIEGLIEVRDPAVRAVAYWLHVVDAARWRSGCTCCTAWPARGSAGRSACAGRRSPAVFAAAMVVLHAQDPRRWNVEGPKEGEQYFYPSLARTATGKFIPAEALHDGRVLPEVPRRTSTAAGRTPPTTSARSTTRPTCSASARRARSRWSATATCRPSRWCAGCHDPVPFFSGAFDDPNFDDVDTTRPAQAGITCTVCHAITHVNSTRGNADYTIEEPQHYPFAFSENRAARSGSTTSSSRPSRTSTRRRS